MFLTLVSTALIRRSSFSSSVSSISLHIISIPPRKKLTEAIGSREQHAFGDAEQAVQPLPDEALGVRRDAYAADKAGVGACGQNLVDWDGGVRRDGEKSALADDALGAGKRG